MTETQNRRQKFCHQMSPKSNVLTLNVFVIRNIEVKHPTSKVWATNVLGVKQLESMPVQFLNLDIMIINLLYKKNNYKVKIGYSSFESET